MNLVVRKHSRVPYLETWARMREFVDRHEAWEADELWFLEHDQVYTLGLAGQTMHILDPGSIPVIHTDRGGQVTYHGPGQLIAYVLVDLHRLGIGPRELVRRLEAAVIALLGDYGIDAERRPKAPGVYVAGAKVAALGLRIRRGISYHGLALNVDADLEPFSRINPCGYAGLKVTSLRELGLAASSEEVRRQLETQLITALYGPAAPLAVTRNPGQVLEQEINRL